MYLDYFSLRAKPFQLLPDPGFLFPSVAHKRALAYLEYGPATRVPAQIRRPTFLELYDRPKLMAAEYWYQKTGTTRASDLHDKSMCYCSRCVRQRAEAEKLQNGAQNEVNTDSQFYEA